MQRNQDADKAGISPHVGHHHTNGRKQSASCRNFGALSLHMTEKVETS
jgi:hypothetical protein